MTLTLEYAIKHCEEVAEKNEKQASYIYIKEGNPYYEYYAECASEHRQLAEWLKALKEIWDSSCCNDCRNRQCEWKPELGQLVRYNCPHYVGIANAEVKADEDR